MSADPITSSEQSQLLDLARQSVKHGLAHGNSLQVDPENFQDMFTRPGASFVTLEIGRDLRGCIGTVKPYRPLVADVVGNAWCAAFKDPRFNPVTPQEFKKLSFEISILSEPQTLEFDSEDELIQQIQPGIDGLIISEGGYSALFLPAVWEKLPDLDTFLSHLKMKAGLSATYWSDSVEVRRFTTFEFSDH